VPTPIETPAKTAATTATAAISVESPQSAVPSRGAASKPFRVNRSGAENFQRQQSGVAEHFSKFSAVPMARRTSRCEVCATRAVLGFLKSDPKKPENDPKTGPFSRKNNTTTQCYKDSAIRIADNNNTTQPQHAGRIFQLPKGAYFSASKEWHTMAQEVLPRGFLFWLRTNGAKNQSQMSLLHRPARPTPAGSCKNKLRILWIQCLSANRGRRWKCTSRHNFLSLCSAVLIFFWVLRGSAGDFVLT
jgi:hypothetical protein